MSGVVLCVIEPTGEDEMSVLETVVPPLAGMLELARRVGRTAAGVSLDWARLPMVDLGAAALLMRRSWLGDLLLTDTRCAATDCRARVDVSFSLREYMEHHRPRPARGVTRSADGGWFELSGATARFRIPTVADVVEAASDDRPMVVSRLCVDPPGLSPALVRRVQRALSRVAPSLDGLVGGSCPECRQDVTISFEPLVFVLTELRDTFADIHLDVHALAAAYGWSEQVILALPRGRRRRLATIIAAEGSVA